MDNYPQRPRVSKKPKSQKKRSKELRAKKIGNRVDQPQLVAIWEPVYEIDANEPIECDYWWYISYDERDIPCMNCHRCKNTKPKEYISCFEQVFVVY